MKNVEASIVFFGNTKYSVISASKIHAVIPLKAAVTIPDRIVGREKVFTPSPVKKFAQTNNIPVIETDKIDDSIIEEVKKLDPDFLVVADYGLILPQKLLDIPKIAPLNIHHSLLPKYRGPSPVPFTILNGEEISGVTIIIMNNTVDSGDIVAQKEYELKPDETTDSLLTKLNELGGEIIMNVLKNFDSIIPTKQDESQASFSKRFTKDNGYIDISDDINPIELDRKIRAYYPWPGVWTRLQMANARPPGISSAGEVGRGKWQIVKFLPSKKIQVEGKKEVSYKDFMNGYPELKATIERLM